MVISKLAADFAPGYEAGYKREGVPPIK